MEVEVVSPERILFSGEADMVVCRTSDGDIAFMANHAPFIGALGIGAVRIYANGSYPTFARVSSYAMEDGHGLADRLIALNSPQPCPGEPCASDRPSFASVSDFASMFRTNVTTDRIGLRIEPWVAGTPLRAFVSITNNETQQVTVVSPQ